MTKSILAQCPAVLGLLIIGALPSSAHADQCHVENVRLLLGTYEMKLVPLAPRCVTVGGDFTIVLQIAGDSAVQPELGDVTVHEKADNGLMIRGSNDSDPLQVVVEVSGSAAEDEYVPYYVTVKDVGTLDPLVRVIGDSALSDAQSSAFRRLAETELGLDDAEFNALLRKLSE